MLAGLAVLAWPSVAVAQAAAPRWELGVSLLWQGPMSAGSASADLIRPDGGVLPLLRTQADFGAGPGVEVRLATAVTRRLAAAVTGSWTRTDVRVRVTEDVDGAPPLTLAETVSRVAIEGAGLWTLATRPRASIYARAGAGWMREVAGGGLLVEDGGIGTVGAGVKYWWRLPPPGRGRALGLSAEGRAVVRSGGLRLGARGLRVSPAASVGLVMGF